ncbi:MAG: hypothetical protein V1885_01885 [Candidatus Brennerbacteria bacterium]
MRNLEKNGFEVGPEEQEEVASFEERAEDLNFLARVGASGLARMGRRLALLAALLSPELFSQESGAEQMVEAVRKAKQSEDRIVNFIKPEKEGGFLRKDFRRVEPDGKTVFQSGFARTDGKQLVVHESAHKDPQSGNVLGGGRYWHDGDMDGRADKMVYINGETDASADSAALAYFGKGLDAIAEADASVDSLRDRRKVFVRGGEVWSVVGYGDPRIKQLKPEQALGLQEAFEASARNVAEKIEQGTTR